MTLWGDKPALIDSSLSLKAQEPLDSMVDVLDDLIRIGANYCERLQAGHGHGDEPMPSDKLVAILMIRNMLTTADGIGILMRLRTSDPIVPLLRQQMEILMGLKWMLREDQSNRARAYFVVQQLNIRHHLVGSLPGTDRQKTIAKDASCDDIVHEIKPVIPADKLNIEINKIDKCLGQNKYSNIMKELNIKKRPPPWYSINGGPKNFRMLCKEFNELGSYEFVYRILSSSVHGHNALSGLGSNGEMAHVIPIRCVNNIPTYFNLVIARLFRAIIDVAKTFGSEGDLKELYNLYKNHIYERKSELVRIEFKNL